MADPAPPAPHNAPDQPAKKPLPPAAERQAVERPKEAGRKGPDPTRYGDWENKGIASDF